MKNIYIGNLSFEATEQTIRALFEPFGTVDRVSVVTDRDTGQPRGFGFVEMPNDAEAEKAIASLNGQPFSGKTIAVNEARPKTDRSSGRGDRRPSGRDRFSREAPRPYKGQILS
jgi:cold-inducible RNA-binding protein